MSERIYKILAATGIPAMDNGIQKISQCELTGSCSERNKLNEAINQMQPQIVIVSDQLNGTEDIPKLLIQLKKKHQYIRFIYLAGQLDPRDTQRVDALGRMVLSGIYDIVISKNINMSTIEELIKNPKEEDEVSFLAKNILNSATPDDFSPEDALLDALPQAGDMVVGTMENVYVFTSIKPGTGKSFLAVNTACAIASYGRSKSDGSKPKVALLEADLQTLSIGTILNIKENKTKNMKAAMEAISTIFDKGNMIGDSESVDIVNKIITGCMVPYEKLPNLHVLTGSTLTPEEITALKISPEYYIYLLDTIRKEYDIVIIDTNSSMFHITTYPILQKAQRCYYIINLDINNVRNNLRYYGTLKKLGLVKKIKWILNENIENNNKYKDMGIGIEKLEFTADEFEEKYFKLCARIPSMQKSIFLNRLYDGTPVVLDKAVSYTKDVKLALMGLASQIWDMEDAIDQISKEKSSGGFFSKLFRKGK